MGVDCGHGRCGQTLPECSLLCGWQLEGLLHMRLGQAYRKALPPQHGEALYSAAEILSDSMVDDLVAIRDGSWTANGSYLASMLPPRYVLRYTPQFVRRFHACLLTVIWKLGQRERILLSCVAEELAAHILIQEAVAVLETAGEKADFGAFEDELFEDLDFEMLYDDAYDGIEETEFATVAGVVNLGFADWFTRFGPPDNDTYPEPHPFAWDSAAASADEPDDNDLGEDDEE